MEKKLKKIIHIDMDAFYASVEQINNKEYQNKPLIVGGRNGYGVVTTASYEARKFGVCSAMPVQVAKNLCPSAIVVSPNKSLYGEYSRIIKKIFLKYTDLVEQASIDEAYLDVTKNKLNIKSATKLAMVIQEDVYKTTSLTCSCGVSYNKFLAKSASDINKPNGVYTISPDDAKEFLEKLSIHKFHGIGRKTASKMISLGVYTGFDLKQISLEILTKNFLSRGIYYYNVVRGVDDSRIIVNRPMHSISKERTFNRFIITNYEFQEICKSLFKEIYSLLLKKGNIFLKTVTVKIKDENFKTTTRSKSISFYTNNKKIIFNLLLCILKEIELERKLRLVGLVFSNFSPEDQTYLINQNKQLKLF